LIVAVGAIAGSDGLLQGLPLRLRQDRALGGEQLEAMIEECVAKIRRYLPDEAARDRIAAAGRARAERSGYHNDAQVAKIVERARQLIPLVRAAAGR